MKFQLTMANIPQGYLFATPLNIGLLQTSRVAYIHGSACEGKYPAGIFVCNAAEHWFIANFTRCLSSRAASIPYGTLPRQPTMFSMEAVEKSGATPRASGRRILQSKTAIFAEHAETKQRVKKAVIHSSPALLTNIPYSSMSCIPQAEPGYLPS